MPAGAALPNAAEASSRHHPTTERVSSSLRELLAGLVDYAGLFPPASLSMRDMASAYADALTSEHAWMLGRVVVPANRVPELVAERQLLGIAGDAWRVSALYADATAMMAWPAAAPEVVVDACEVKAISREDVRAIASCARKGVETYVEIPSEQDPSSLLDEIARNGLRAKIRTGGTSADTFPSPAHVARFIVQCRERNVAFKATAGLHHPLAGEYRLTYAADAASGTMFGFLNVFMAALLAQSEHYEHVLSAIQERDPRAFVFTDDGVSYHSHVALDAIRALRSSFAMSFGSCSFTEPVHDLQQMGLL